MPGVRPLAFPDPPAANCAPGADEISQFLFRKLLRMLRVFDRVGLVEDSRFAPSPMWPSASLNGVERPRLLDFAAQWLACALPCQRFGDDLAVATA
jgi:hypothetical protein